MEQNGLPTVEDPLTQAEKAAVARFIALAGLLAEGGDRLRLLLMGKEWVPFDSIREGLGLSRENAAVLLRGLKEGPLIESCIEDNVVFYRLRPESVDVLRTTMQSFAE